MPGVVINSFPNNKFLDSSKHKKLADDTFELDENGGTLSDRVENAVGNEKLLIVSNFSFFTTRFSKYLNCRQVKARTCLEMVQLFTKPPIFRQVQIKSSCRRQNKCE